MFRLILTPLAAQPTGTGWGLDPGFFTLVGVFLLVLSFAALRRAIQPIQHLLAAVAAAGLALVLLLVAVLVLLGALAMDIT